MSGSPLHATQITLLALLLAVVVVGTLGRKLQTPYPILLVIAGLVFGFVPACQE